MGRMENSWGMSPKIAGGSRQGDDPDQPAILAATRSNTSHNAYYVQLLAERPSTVAVRSRGGRLHAPLRRLVVAGLLVLLRSRGVLVDLARGVVHRRVDRVQAHWLVAGVDDVVPHAGGHQHAPTVGNVLLELEAILRRADAGLAAAGVQAQELVGFGVHLQPDRSADRDRHQRDLQVAAAPGDRAVVAVFGGGGLQVEAVRPGTDICDL